MRIPFYIALPLVIHAGIRTRRDEWPIGSFIVYMSRLYLPPFNTQDTNRKVNDRTAKWIGEDVPLDSQAYLAFFDGDSQLWQPGWTPNIMDMLATDWLLIGEAALLAEPYLPKINIEHNIDRDLANNSMMSSSVVDIGWHLTAGPSKLASDKELTRDQIEEILAERVLLDTENFRQDPYAYIAAQRNEDKGT